MSQNLRMVSVVLLVSIMIGAGVQSDSTDSSSGKAGAKSNATPDDSIRTIDDLIRSLRPNAPMEWPSPLDVEIAVEPHPLRVGPASLNVKAKLNCQCNDVRIELARDDNVNYQGQRKWSNQPESGDSVLLTLPIVVPRDDTCGIQLRLYCGEMRQWATVYFVSTAESVKRFDYDIRSYGIKHQGARKSIGTPDSVFWQEGRQQSGVKRMQYYSTEDGELVPTENVIDGITLDGRRVGHYDADGNFVALDSVLKFNRLQELTRKLMDSVVGLPGGAKGRVAHPLGWDL